MRAKTTATLMLAGGGGNGTKISTVAFAAAGARAKPILTASSFSMRVRMPAALKPFAAHCLIINSYLCAPENISCRHPLLGHALLTQPLPAYATTRALKHRARKLAC